MALTLTRQELLSFVIQGFAAAIYPINKACVDFRQGSLKLNKKYTAKIVDSPGIQPFSAATGIPLSAAKNARDLYRDIDITVTTAFMSPIRWNTVDRIKDDQLLAQEAMSRAGYALARGFIQDIFRGCRRADNFSGSKAYAVADCDLDFVTEVGGEMNKRKASTIGRRMVINTDVANTLGGDQRVMSNQFYGKLQNNDNAVRSYKSLQGFGAIDEVVELSDGAEVNAVDVTANTLTVYLHNMKVGDKVQIATTGALPGGMAAATDYYVTVVDGYTLTVSATLGGAAVNITSAGTGVHTLTPQDGFLGFAWEDRAMGLIAGAPETFDEELLSMLNIPRVRSVEPLTDPDTGITMASVSYQDQVTGDLLWSPVLLWGKRMGIGDGGAAGAETDNAGFRLVKA